MVLPMNKPKLASSTSAPATSDTVVQHLTKVLADTYVLGVKTHGAHWNVTGADFFRLHGVFDEQYHALLLAADDIAERVRALGAVVPGSMRQLLEHTAVGEPPVGYDAMVVQALRDDHRQIAVRCREAISVAAAAHDQGSADLLTSRSVAHDKIAWMLTATLDE